MDRVDLSDNARIPIISEILTLASRAREPQDVFRTFGPRLWRIRPIDYFISLSVRNLPAGSFKITRQYPVTDLLNAPAGTLPPNANLDPWSKWGQMPIHSTGFLASLIADDAPKLLKNLRITDDPVLGNVLADMGSCIALPLFDDGHALNWSIQFRRSPDGYTSEYLEDALLLANLIGSMTRNLVALKQVAQLNRQLTAQFEEVARVQQSLLPAVLPKIPGLDLATSYLTSDQAGGDYYDFFPLPDGRWAIIVADVSGHGAGAATIMAMLRAILHCYEPGCATPADAVVDVLRFTNQRLYAARLEGNFVTAFFCIYDPRDHSLAYASAGHPPPRLKPASGPVRAIDDAATLPLGLMPEFEVAPGRLVLQPGDALVLYTDGITEQFDLPAAATDPFAPALDAPVPIPGAKREMFGTHRLDAALADCTGAPDCVVASIHQALFAHTHGSRSRADDQTIVALQRTP